MSDWVWIAPPGAGVRGPLPPPLVDVLLFLGFEDGIPDIDMGYLTPDGAWRRTGEDPRIQPTHWMPLPLPPEVTL